MSEITILENKLRIAQNTIALQARILSSDLNHLKVLNTKIELLGLAINTVSCWSVQGTFDLRKKFKELFPNHVAFDLEEKASVNQKGKEK